MGFFSQSKNFGLKKVFQGSFGWNHLSNDAIFLYFKYNGIY